MTRLFLAAAVLVGVLAANVQPAPRLAVPVVVDPGNPGSCPPAYFHRYWSTFYGRWVYRCEWTVGV